MSTIQKNNIIWWEPVYTHFKNQDNTLRGKVKRRTCEVDIRPCEGGIRFIMPLSICVNECKGDNLKSILNEIRTVILKEFQFLYNDVSFYSRGNDGEYYFYDYFPEK